MSQWYMTNLGLKALISNANAPFAHFLADETGRVFLELYTNPIAPFTDFAAAHPLVLHVAFYTPDAGAVQQKLVAAGATPVSDDTTPDGSRLMFVRDPWGLAVQLCQRTKPFPGF